VEGRDREATKFPTKTTAGGVVVVAPRGHLDMTAAPDLNKQLLDLVHSGRSLLVVDMSAVELIDSSGLGALVSALEAARTSGGDLKIMSPREQPSLVLELTNVNRVLRTVASADDAFDDHA
jgi:anti-sigma B factor antagonist